MNHANNKECDIGWTNITKIIELKDPAVGLIKSSYGGDAKTNDNGNAQNAATAPSHKIILNQISGRAKAGEIMALMGPSGSGKTSLLDVLSTRSAYEGGEVTVNGLSITNDSAKIKALKRMTAYIKQQDLFFDHLTVKDQLTYTAFLRMGDDVTKEEKIAEVNKVIQLLRLQKCADTPISLVSGGEKKRVNIGTELLINPSVLMLDEPTSGLDSTSAAALVDLLVSLAHDHGKTVIMSIHQPSSAVFTKFDKVLLLADGCVVYYGSPKESLQYTKKYGYPCPEGYNGSEHWMDLLVEDSAIPQEDMVVRQDLDDTEDMFPIKGHSLTDTADGMSLLAANEVEKQQNGSSLVIMNGSADREKQANPANSTNVSTAVDSESGYGSGNAKKVGIQKIISRLSTTAVRSTHLIDQTKQKRNEYTTLTTPKARLITAWDVNAFARDMVLCGKSHSTSSSTEGTQNVAEVPEKKFNTCWMTQFRVLLHRALKNSNSKIFTRINIFKSFFLGLFVGLLWFQMPNDASHLDDRMSFLFFASTYWTFDGMFSAIFAFPMERNIIFKERASGSYQISAYFLSRTLSSLPSQLAMPVVFWIIAYWMANINEDVFVFLAVMGISLLSNLAGESFGLLCGSIIMDFQQALATMTVVSLTLMAAAGLYIKNIPNFLIWVKYLSPFKPAFEASMILVFKRGVECDDSGALPQYCTEGVKYATSEQVLEALNSDGTVGLQVCIAFLLMLVPRYLAFLALKSKKTGERGE